MCALQVITNVELPQKNLSYQTVTDTNLYTVIGIVFVQLAIRKFVSSYCGSPQHILSHLDRHRGREFH